MHTMSSPAAESAPSGRVIAVAGATGNAGREIVRALADRGQRVRALVRDPARLGPVRERCAEIVIVEVTRAGSLKGALDGADALVTAVGKTFQKDRLPRRAVDLDANVNLFTEARAAGVRRIGLVSVATARPDHPVAMVAMKGKVEQRLEATGIPWVIIQPSGYFSDMWEIFQMCARGTLWQIGDGKMRFNPISLIDLGDFIADHLLDDAAVGERWPVGGPEALTTVDIADRAERVLGRRVKRRSLPLWLARAGVACVRPFSRNAWELGDFFVGQVAYAARHLDNDATVPAYGTHLLEDYFRERWAREQAARRPAS